jgi:hypothetical protein
MKKEKSKTSYLGVILLFSLFSFLLSEAPPVVTKNIGAGFFSVGAVETIKVVGNGDIS